MDGSANATGVASKMRFAIGTFFFIVDASPGTAWGLMDPMNPARMIMLRRVDGGIAASIGDGTTWDNRTLVLAVPSGYNRYEIMWSLSNVKIYVNDILLMNSTTIPLVDMNILMVALGGASTSTSQLKVDSVSVGSWLAESTMTSTWTTTATSTSTVPVTVTSTQIVTATSVEYLTSTRYFTTATSTVTADTLTTTAYRTETVVAGTVTVTRTYTYSTWTAQTTVHEVYTSTVTANYTSTSIFLIPYTQYTQLTVTNTTTRISATSLYTTVYAFINRSLAKEPTMLVIGFTGLTAGLLAMAYAYPRLTGGKWSHLGFGRRGRGPGSGLGPGSGGLPPPPPEPLGGSGSELGTVESGPSSTPTEAAEAEGGMVPVPAPESLPPVGAEAGGAEAETVEVKPPPLPGEEGEVGKPVKAMKKKKVKSTSEKPPEVVSVERFDDGLGVGVESDKSLANRLKEEV
jgi:hypothetical protein